MTASTAITPFNFNNNDVRVILRDGEPWFVATDVAESLGYKSPKDAASYLDDDEKGSAIARTPGGDQKLTVINESGLYALVLRSRKPEARKFAKWVTSEVLPSIRKTGQYTAAPYTVQPTDTLNEAQQTALRAMLESNVKRLPEAKRGAAMVQGWSKLKAHFGVPYRQIPASEFTEALSIVARHVTDWELVDETAKKPEPLPNADRLSLAFSVAAEAGAQVQRTVFEQLANGINPEAIHARTMAGFTFDRDGKPAIPWARAMQPREFITTADTLPKMISSSDLLLSDVQVSEIISACANVVSKRAVSRIAA